MNELNFGRRMSQAIQEKDWRKILRLILLAIRVANREYNPPGWRMTVFLSAVFAVSWALFAFAGKALAWTAFAALASYWLLVRIPRRVRHTLEENREFLDRYRSERDTLER
jgi:hypothetical protein